ncbi:hypothetical protein ACH5RR_038797 [Cinchona calisaya]|uniref:Protein kinase domain-containing protein n=1 Tax=Cinchona calisaya TaxID=153742 RepID=A0ABD2XZT6_9GENT
MMMISYLIRIIIVVSFTALGSGKNSSLVRRCSHHGPKIRFPFWLKDNHDPEGYPGFGLSCTQTKDTVLELPFPVKASVLNETKLPFSVNFVIKEIDYKFQMLLVSKVEGCLPALLPKLDLSASPFHFQDVYDQYDGYAFFNCSANRSNYYWKDIPCLSTPSYQVYAVRSFEYAFRVPLMSCNKMFYIPSVPLELFDLRYSLELNWSEPPCGDCEAEGKSCRFKDNRRPKDIECFDDGSHPGPLEKVKRAGLVIGPLLLVLIVIGTYQIFHSKKLRKEDQQKIEQFLEDYKALKPTRYSYADIKRITGNFSDKLGQGGYGTVYKGQLSNEVSVAVKVLNNTKGDGEDFINEFLPNHSLEKFTSSKNDANLLGLEKLHDIALGIAKGIEYLHQGCEQRILHFDIKPHNILLDHNFNPKISDFGQAKLCSKEQSAVSMTAARGTMGYIAPEVFSRNFGKVSYKSDVYSFGMVLLEMVGGMKNIIHIGAQDNSEAYFPEWIYNKLEKGEDITIEIENEDDSLIARKLMIAGLWCIQWYPVDRPSMKVVIQMLEAEEIPPMPRNPFGSEYGTGVVKKIATVSVSGSGLTSISEESEE